MTGDQETRFVLHDHAAKHHHFDLRLERGGVLKSWAVPKGMPETPGERRLAIAVEDHELAYIGFEGTIPEGGYGAGTVAIADAGTYETLVWDDERIEVILNGARYRGKYVLVRFKKAGEKEWLVMKAKG
jgi:DNA ligase D-like protein (predicted 3'-phosphoesterase)